MLDKIAQIGRQAALAAGAVMRLNYGKPHEITMKGAIDPVTETDFQCQAIIIGMIRQAFPDHVFLAEERGGEGEAGTSAPAGPAWEADPPPTCRWIIDPLDGTVNFAHGYPAFCVSIAFETDGEIEYGVVYDPLRDELFEARRGGGAYLNRRPIRVSKTDCMERALIATGFPYDIRERVPETVARLGRMLAHTQGVRRGGSAALDMGYVACGRLDGFYEENLKPWDTAAGLLIIHEAGGKITTFNGGDYDIYAPNIAASNGFLHEHLLSCLNKQIYLFGEPQQALRKPFYVGVDGCNCGWFAIVLTKDWQWQTEVFPNISALWERYREASLILLDVPIGLKEKGAEERRCDREARRILGPDRGRAVFRVPCRQAIYAATDEEAKSVNKRLTGKSLPVQTLGIIPKIREVDKLLLSDGVAKASIKEVHPELCFWSLAGRPMQYKKDTREGYDERLQVLELYPQTNAIVSYALSNYRRKDMAKDDILDALAAAVTAFKGLGDLISLPDPPEFDDRGLPMQMLYRPRSAE
jgi:myo-inositol-1(or 4)-monophosphatase